MTRIASQPIGGPHWDPLTKHVLLICGNRKASEVTELALISLGYTVQTTCDGGDPLAYLRHDKFSGVVFDLDTSNRGREIIAEIRQQYRSLPMVTLTEFPDTEEAVQCMKIGVNDYLVKPISLEAVKAVLGRWFGEGR